MAVLKAETFPTDSDGAGLLKKVKQGLTNLSGHGPAKDGTYLSPPHGLDADRDMLRDDYRDIWRGTTIQYKDDETGASVNIPNKLISLGGFFLRPSHKVLDIQKVILHEYLHLVLTVSSEFQHSQMTQVITYNLGYPGDANPFGTD